MKNTLRTILALFAAGALIFLAIKTTGVQGQETPKEVRMIRVWITDKEPAVSAWLKSLAAGYEKETGERVYLRVASAAEAAAARQGGGNVIPPDVLILSGGDSPVALRGYALIIRDDTVRLATPAPTSALFYRPSPSPGPSPTPGPTPDPNSFSAVLAPEELTGALPGAVRSGDPAADLAQGKAGAALLTAGQAARLSFGYQAYALPGGAGMLAVCAECFTPAGEGFRDYLLGQDAQQALARFGLYSPFLRLYGGDDPLRALVEGSFDPADKIR